MSYKDTKAWQYLSTKYSKYVNLNELSSLAEVLSCSLDIDLNDEDEETMESLILWYQKYYDTLIPFIEEHITVRAENDEIIDYSK